ncbi:hypothetical protein B0T19DRAFT_455969 [Cercophora scortea]|uniref:Uncharacterized protein n=1 Tax=Cercophora scortea TaxID=314031 RepID=A0AAE0IUQ7_9PEZI|nr:hypothetical protein B0T19DRAFT_455969 [Cercophora scortea]
MATSGLFGSASHSDFDDIDSREYSFVPRDHRRSAEQMRQTPDAAELEADWDFVDVPAASPRAQDSDSVTCSSATSYPSASRDSESLRTDSKMDLTRPRSGAMAGVRRPTWANGPYFPIDDQALPGDIPIPAAPLADIDVRADSITLPDVAAAQFSLPQETPSPEASQLEATGKPTATATTALEAIIAIRAVPAIIPQHVPQQAPILKDTIRAFVVSYLVRATLPYSKTTANPAANTITNVTVVPAALASTVPQSTLA